jgi:hypothetical protein
MQRWFVPKGYTCLCAQNKRRERLEMEESMFKITHKNKRYYIYCAVVWLILMGTAFYFCTQKQGFHEDEYYTYYSTARTNGFYVEDGQWMDQDTIRSEFVVLPGQGFQYGLVKQVQSWDVHPPLYYWVFHTAASLVPGTFSKWIGLVPNLIFHGINIILLTYLSYLVSRKNEKLALLVTFAYGLTPAAISGVVFIRMYEMLTLWVLVCAILHVRAVQSRVAESGLSKEAGATAESRSRADRLPLGTFLVPAAVVTYLGFLTQYYYVIFLFYLGMAFCVYLLWRDRNLWNILRYGVSQCVALLLAYLTYPSCLGQMFKGQRGAQATENFFDLSNTLERFAFFYDLLNEYVFGKLLTWLLLLMVVLAVTVRALAGRRMSQAGRLQAAQEIQAQAQTAWMQDSTLQAESHSDVPQGKQVPVTGAAFWILTFAAAGYFLTVSKTALLLGSTSNRYQLPVYGIVVLILFVGVYELGRRCAFRGSEPVVAAVLLLLVVDIVSLAGGKVVFLYPEDKEQVAFAAARASEDAPVIYFYDEGADWCIWDVTDELMEYPAVYFAAAGGGALEDESSGSAAGQLEDERIGNASELVVYVADGADAAEEIGRITDQYPQFTEWELMFEEKYCQVYWVKTNADGK